MKTKSVTCAESAHRFPNVVIVLVDPPEFGVF